MLGCIQGASGEVLRLRKIMRKNRNDNLLFLRLQTCMLWRMGYNQVTISEITGLSKVTINKYIKEYKDDPLFIKKKNLEPGRPSFLSKQQKEALIEAILNDDHYWTIRTVMQFVEQKFGVAYTEPGIRKLLKGLLEVHEYRKISIRASTGF